MIRKQPLNIYNDNICKNEMDKKELVLVETTENGANVKQLSVCVFKWQLTVDSARALILFYFMIQCVFFFLLLLLHIYTQYSFILTLFLFLFYYTKLKYRSIYFPHCSLFKECTQNLSCWYNHLVLSYCPLEHIVISAVKCEIVCEWLVLQLNIGQYVFSLARSFTVKAYSWAIVFYFSFIFLLLLLCIVRMVFCGNNNK